jgi:hypothetical protein
VGDISDFAFQGCSGITSITIPANVQHLGIMAFRNCGSLASAYFMGASPYMEVSVFDNAAPEFTVYYFSGFSGFSSPLWRGYPAVGMGDKTLEKIWLIDHEQPHDSSLIADSDGDGVSLLLAYALGLDPRNNLSGSLPKPIIASGQIHLDFFAATPGVTYRVESSTNLNNWTTQGVTTSTLDANHLRASANRSGSSLYLRIAVSTGGP